MCEIINKFLLAGDTFMTETHLRQTRITYSAGRPFTKNKERIQIFKEAGDLKYIYQNKLDKACFQHILTYGGFKDLLRRTTSDKVIRDEVLNIDKKTKYGRCHERWLAAMV